MGNDGIPMSIVVLVSVIFITAMALAGAIVLVLLSKGLTLPVA
jgi:hypothetical protein